MFTCLMGKIVVYHANDDMFNIEKRLLSKRPILLADRATLCNAVVGNYLNIAKY